MTAPALSDLVLFRAQVEATLRAFFAMRGIVEIATPSLVDCPGMEPHLRAFAVKPVEATELQGRWLHTSPELAIKAALHELDFDVFTISRCYRDEPPTPLHHPEFTMLEWYRRRSDYNLLMADCEALIGAVMTCLGGPLTPGDDAGRAPNLTEPFERVTCEAAFLRAAGVSPSASAEDLVRAARARGIDVCADWDRATLFSLLYAECVEPSLGWPRPTFITEFPAAEAALARLKPNDPSVAERFELYLGCHTASGVVTYEIANAFSELVDPDEQRERFEESRRRRAEAGLAVYPLPLHVLAGLEALDETAGIALGVERLLVWAAATARGWETTIADWFVA